MRYTETNSVPFDRQLIAAQFTLLYSKVFRFLMFICNGHVEELILNGYKIKYHKWSSGSTLVVLLD